MSSLTILQKKVSVILKAAEKETDFKQLRSILNEAARHQLIEFDSKSINLRFKTDKQQLLKTANSFLNTKLITKSTIIERGWTKSLIKQYLGLADAQAKNPVCASASPMQLYTLYRVESIEQLEHIKIAIAKVLTRRPDMQAKALAAADTKRQELLTWVELLTIDIINLEIPALLKRSTQHYNRLWAAREEFDKRADALDSAEFLTRISTNYLRHACCRYECWLDELNSRVGCALAYGLLKEKINAAIVTTYPALEQQIKLWQEQQKTYEADSKQS